MHTVPVAYKYSKERPNTEWIYSDMNIKNRDWAIKLLGKKP